MMKLLKNSYLAVAFVLLLSACGGNESKKSGGAGLQEQTKIDYVFPETTRYVSSEDDTSILSLDGEGEKVVLVGDSQLAESTQEGNILVFGVTSHTPRGLLRKVTGRTSEGQSLVLETVPATIPEAFQELDLKIVRPLKYGAVESYETQLDGLELKRFPLDIEGEAASKIELDFNGTVLFDKDGDESTTDDQITADGSISFTLGMTLEASIELFSLTRLKMGAHIEQEGALQVATPLSLVEFDEEVVVAELYFATFSLGPVVVTPSFELVLGANGELKAEVSTGIEESFSGEAGAIYQDGIWTPFSEFSSNWSFLPPTLSSSMRLKAYFGPRLNLTIYGVAGPYVQVDGYLELEADESKNPWWQLFGGLEAFLGIRGEVPIFGYTVELFDYKSGDLLGYRELIAKAEVGGECVPDCEGKECGDGGCSEQPEVCGACSSNENCVFGECIAECQSSDEVCDSIDNDCDGKTDESWTCDDLECDIKKKVTDKSEAGYCIARPVGAIELPDGCYLSVARHSYVWGDDKRYDTLMLKTEADGHTKKWDKELGVGAKGPGLSVGAFAAEYSKLGVILVGERHFINKASHDDHSLWASQFSPSGQMLNEFTFDGYPYSLGTALAESSSGRVVLGGVSRENQYIEGGSAFLVALDEDWNLLWQVPPNLQSQSRVNGITVGAEGRVWIAGTYDGQAWLALFDNAGSKLFEWKYGGSHIVKFGHLVVQDEHLLVTGLEHVGDCDAPVLARISTDGQLLSSLVLAECSGTPHSADLAVAENGKIIVAGGSWVAGSWPHTNWQGSHATMWRVSTSFQLEATYQYDRRESEYTSVSITKTGAILVSLRDELSTPTAFQHLCGQ